MAGNVLATYSELDIVGSFSHPLVGTFPFSGGIGLNQITITKSGDNTAMDVAADGGVTPSAIADNRGTAVLEMQQTSPMHDFLLSWFNTIYSNLQNNDVSNWSNATLSIRSVNEGSMHFLTGIAPQKVPDKPYAKQNQNVTWTLMAADVVSE